jgi:FkbM family methyltransferase
MMNRIKRQVKRLLKTIPFKQNGQEEIKIKDISLIVDSSDDGGRAYAARSSHEEYVNPIYADIISYLDPHLVIDVGANYGFTGLIFAKRFRDAKIVLVEASPHLCTFIHRNFELNMMNNYEVINAICGRIDDSKGMFFFNPSNSQDNRVIGLDGWKSIQAPMKSLSRIIEEIYISGNIFIKIDTQGFEERVFSGVEDFLSKHDNWLIKTEFAPYWLKSQGTDPLEFLRTLVTNYMVIEAPARSRFKRDNINRLFSEPLSINESEDFLSYIVSLNDNDLGWCDLLIKPKGQV